MKLNFKYTCLTAALLVCALAAFAQDDNTSLSRYNALIAKINADLAAGKHTQAELADDLNQFDVLLAAEKGRRTDLAADILLQKGMVFADVLGQPDEARKLFLEIKTNYANTKDAAGIDDLVKSAEHLSQMKQIRTALAPGTHFPDFSGTNTAGQPLSVAQYKGRVVLLDFWATWCPLCLAEMPNVITTYAKYHDQGFEIIGISLDDNLEKLSSFTTASKMSWAQYCDGQGWESRLVTQYGVTDLPDNLLIDASGNIIGRNMSGEALGQAVAKALTK